jgi:peptide/nickel transport system substrate-binding protein
MDPQAAVPAPAENASANRTLIVIGRVEPAHLSNKVQVSGSGASSGTTKRLFNAGLTFLDEHETPQPYLAERLPQLNTDTWRVSADGRMETTWHLRPGITWHDGTPFSAEDFVFAWRVYTDPDTGGFTPAPQGLMDEVVAPDPRTVVIRWKQPYGEADQLSTDFLPLPRHILEPVFQRDRGDVFLGHPYWTREYVGLGPFKVERWEPGAFIEGSAFAGHVWGKPKFGSVHVQFVSDPNTALARLLSEAAHIADDESLRFQQGVTLKREWGPRSAGTVLLNPNQLRYIQVQFRPEFAAPRAVLDLRVRKALAHAIDKQALADGLLEGEGKGTDTMISPLVGYFADVDRVVTKYPYDLRRTEQLMAEAGFTKSSDGLYATGGERFSPELRTIAGAQEEQEMAILADAWRQAGVDVKPYVLPVAQSQDGLVLASFPALATATSGGVTGTEQLFKKIATVGAPAPENRWRGSALGGWSNPRYDGLYDAFNTTLDRKAREQVVAQMMQLVSEELPIFTLYHNFTVTAHVAALNGPRGGTAWNVQEWELR